MPFDISDFKTEQPKSPAQAIQVIGGGSSGGGGGGNSMDLTDFNIDEFFKSIKPDVEAPLPVPPVSSYSSKSSSSSAGVYMDHFDGRRQEHSTRTSAGGHYGQQQQQHQQQLNSYHSPPLPTPSGFQQQPQINRHQHNHNNQHTAAYHQDGGGGGGGGGGGYNSSGYNQQHANNNASFQQQEPIQYQSDPVYGSHNNIMPLAPPPLPPSNLSISSNNGDEYNPDTWEMSWASSGVGGGDDSFQIQETPVSPPHFERKAGANVNVIEYVDPNSESAAANGPRGAGDVDHRQLHIPPPQSHGGAAGGACGIAISAISKEKARAIDVDHRNLISLTGSPRTDGASSSSSGPVKQPLLPLQPPNMWKGDTVSNSLLN